jgi:Zn-dependent protease
MWSILVWNLVGAILHESGHILTTLAFGLKVKRVKLSWRGIGVYRELGSPVQNALIAAAGPLFNLLLCLSFLHNRMALLVNATIFVMNVIPFPQSDGRRILEYLSDRGAAEQ